MIIAISVYIRRNLTQPLNEIDEAISRLSGGDYDFELNASSRADEIGGVAKSLDQLREDLKRTETAARTRALKSAAFEKAAPAMMMIDREQRVVFLNKSMEKMFRDHARAFRAARPAFDPARVIGSNLDLYQADQKLQRRLLSDMSRPPCETDLAIGDRLFTIAVSPINDAESSHAGAALYWRDVTDVSAAVGAFKSLSRAQAVIEYTLDGAVVGANENYLKAFGYTIEEITGRAHSMFLDSADVSSPEYDRFWERLRQGERVCGKFRRMTKGGGEIWLETSYNPVLDRSGKPFKIIEFAADVTAIEITRRQNEEKRAHKAAEQGAAVAALAIGLKKLAEGDLTTNLDTSFTEEYEYLRIDFNAAVDKISSALKSIAANADSIHTGVGELSHAADDLSRRTEGQAATLEQTAASLEQLTASVKAAAEGADKANQVVSEAKENAKGSGQVVRDAVDSMSEIEKSSEKISKIIGVIDDIAFQTNLLALNAGVEAARAGDAGRGFAVVASEVRALAQRSSDAAKEIKALISASSEQVGKGVALVGQAGKALQEIVESVANINALVSEIATSAKEQSTGIVEINTAIIQLDQVTQQNSAMVEESTAASHALSQDVESLSCLVATFKTGAVKEKPGGQKFRTATETVNADSYALTITDQKKRVEHFASALGAPAPKKAVDDWEDF